MNNSKLSKEDYEKQRRPGGKDKRKGIDRRQEPSRGFTCISMVGWICRREQFRRKNDSTDFDTPGK